MLNHIYCFISCNDFKDILDSLLERGLKQLSPGVFGLFRSSIHQMLHVITLSTKQTIFAPPCRRLRLLLLCEIKMQMSKPLVDWPPAAKPQK